MPVKRRGPQLLLIAALLLLCGCDSGSREKSDSLVRGRMRSVEILAEQLFTDEGRSKYPNVEELRSIINKREKINDLSWLVAGSFKNRKEAENSEQFVGKGVVQYSILSNGFIVIGGDYSTGYPLKGGVRNGNFVLGTP